MVKTFYHRLINTVLLCIAVIIGIIYVAQNNNLESLRLRALNQAPQSPSAKGDTTALQGTRQSSNPTDARLWYESAFGGLLEADPEPWLPKDAIMGGTLKLLLSSDPKGFNYLVENSADVSKIRTYNQLPLVQRHKTDVTKFAPGLATYIDHSPDFLTFNYRIRPDIFWHKPALTNEEEHSWLIEGKSCIDVGTRAAEELKNKGNLNPTYPLEGARHWVQGRCRVTAHDVVFWIRMMMNPQISGAASKRSYFKDLDLETVKATGDFSLELKFKSKKYKNLLAAQSLEALPEFLYAYDDKGQRIDQSVIGTHISEHWYNPRAMGNGPYRFVKFIPGEVLQLEKDPWFPLAGNAFDSVVFKIVKEQVQHPLMLLKSAESKSESDNQGVHLTELSSQSFRSVMKETQRNTPFHDGTIKHDFYWTYGYSYIGWNGAKPLFSDKRVRRAMSHALRTDDILKEVRFGLGERTTGPITPGLPHYDETLPQIPFDLEETKRLLDAAGWRDSNGNGIRDKIVDGRRMEFEFVFTIINHPSHLDTAEILKEELKKVGVKCTLKAMEWAMFQKELHTKTFDAVMLGWSTSPDVDFDQIWHSRHADTPKSSNYISFRNKEADAIIEQLEIEFDFEKRHELARQFHRIIYEEQPYTFMFRSKVPYFWTPQLRNAQSLLPVRPYTSFRRWYLSGK